MKIGGENIEKVCSRTAADAVSPIQINKKVAKESNTSNNMSALKDIVQISDKAKEYSVGKNFVKAAVKEATAQTDPEKLLKLKRDISSGSYNVPGYKIAEAIIEN